MIRFFVWLYCRVLLVEHNWLDMAIKYMETNGMARHSHAVTMRKQRTAFREEIEKRGYVIVYGKLKRKEVSHGSTQG